MVIGIVGAMAQEVEILKNLLQNKKTTPIANGLLYEGQIQGKAVALMQSGIGKVAAAIGTTALIERCQPNWVINTGSAGGIAPSLNLGDVVVSTEVAYHDVDVTAFGYAKGQLPACPARFKSDTYLITLAEKVIRSQQHTVIKAPICTGDTFVQGGETLANIRHNFPDAVAVEMEAAAIAQTCVAFQVPFVVIRAISDTGNGKANLSFEEFLPLAAQRSSNMILSMLGQL